MTPSNPASGTNNYDVDVIEGAFDDADRAEDRQIEEAFDRDGERRMAEGYNGE